MFGSSGTTYKAYKWPPAPVENPEITALAPVNISMESPTLNVCPCSFSAEVMTFAGMGLLGLGIGLRVGLDGAGAGAGSGAGVESFAAAGGAGLGRFKAMISGLLILNECFF